ncbi:hypothetical protein M6B38_215125 [Iris pallida]|uniref:Uncharacterized protein n=1 Tax=Iris pallida TaxID=29817 RepID=A0AAX6E1L6_IRIPA|nr:hypothetical protein M6B38_215125 [Iris pallida]
MIHQARLTERSRRRCGSPILYRSIPITCDQRGRASIDRPITDPARNKQELVS